MSLLLLALAPQQERPALPSFSPPGTYDILICKGACTFTSTSNVLVRGSLILEAQSFQPPYPPQDAPPPFGWSFGPRDLFLRNGGAANACFVLETLERNQTYAGLIPIGFPAWSQVANTVVFKLYGSPDADHKANVTLTEEGFRGTGSSGGGVAAPPSSWTPDVIIGRRTGPADRSICTSALDRATRQ
jgi:hypothetical protein